MPFSSESLDGYENRIAALISEELDIPLEYTWFPQSMGFIRNTLRMESDTGEGYRCDLVMGVPKEFELATTTDPYFTSTYALVISRTGLLQGIQSLEDILSLDQGTLATTRIGLTERSPGALWMAKNNLFRQMAPYVAQVGDPGLFSGQQLYDDLVSGKLDAAIAWGPVAGYFTVLDENLRLIKMHSEPGMRLDYSISAGVRFREDAWRDQITGILNKNAEKISAILREFNVPLLETK